MGAPTAKAPTACELAQDVLAFVIEFPQGELPLLQGQIEKVLQSDAVKKKLQEQLFEYAFEKTKRGEVFAPIDPKLGEALLKGIGETGQKELVNLVLKDEPARRILRAFDDFKRALSQTPMGVWVDKNKGWLIVVGVVLAVGGSAALFYTRTDSDVVNFPIDQIKGKAIPLWSPGKFTLSAGLLEFRPADRKLGIEVIGEQKWERVELKLKLGVVGSDPVAKAPTGEALVSTREFHTPQMDYKLGIELKLKNPSLPNPIALGLTADFMDSKFKSAGVTAGASYKGVDFKLKGQTDGKETSGWILIGGTF
jgi:hypothetical protein